MKHTNKRYLVNVAIRRDTLDNIKKLREGSQFPENTLSIPNFLHALVLDCNALTNTSEEM